PAERCGFARGACGGARQNTQGDHRPKKKLPQKTPKNPTPIAGCPAEISDGGRKIGDRLAPPLIAEGRLTELDCTTFAILCSAIADWFSAQEALQTYGPVIKSPSAIQCSRPMFLLQPNTSRRSSGFRSSSA